MTERWQCRTCHSGPRKAKRPLTLPNLVDFVIDAARAASRPALGAKFTVPFVEVRRPCLARMLGRADLEAAEHALIDAQMLPAWGSG